MVRFATSVACNLLSKLGEYCTAPVSRRWGYFSRRWGYLTHYDFYVLHLKKELERLDYLRQRVQRSIDKARNNMEIDADIEIWVKDAETITNKARDVLLDDERAKKTCFCGWPRNPKVRYCLSREARRTVRTIEPLIRQKQFEKFFIKSRASILEDIMHALDDEQSTVIGIYGPGGVGKTTLLQEVQKRLSNEKRSFDLIATATVSQTTDLKKIQHNIADALSLDLKNEPSGVGRRDLLFWKLQSDPTKKVLIMLDDLWEPLDLKAVGIPSGDESSRCQVLVTSRFADVLQQMLVSRMFRLTGLEHNEAFRLFEKMVGDGLKDNEELRVIAAQRVRKLAGLPLLIMSLASTLKYSPVSAWKNMLIKIDEPYIETIVKLSYDHLKSEDAKSLFLLCGLIGGTIQVETLLGLGVGLGLFEGFNKTIQHSRDRLNTMLGSLRSFCLLRDGGDDKENVTIHDLYSEVAVSTPFRDENSLMMNSNHGSWPKEKLEKCWAICLINVVNDRLVELMPCQFTNLKILMLSQPENWLGSPAHQYDKEDCCGLDFKYMKDLQVLYLHSMHITTLPSSIEILVNLRSLYLDNCHVKDVAILGKLKALQILSFAGSAINRLPKEIGELTKMRYLNLSNCNMLRIIEPGVLESLINLEELHMKGSFDRLEILVRDPTILLEDGDLPFENLIRFCINLENVEGRTFQGLRTMELEWEECDNVLSRGWVQKTLHETQYLHLDRLRESKENAHELCTQGFGQLKHLDIFNSPSIKYIANSSEGLPLAAFTILESLFLENLINLENICHGPVAPECFSKLKVMGVKRCDRLKNLWCLSGIPTMTSFYTRVEITSDGAPTQVVFPFQHLKTLDVSHCDELSKMFTPTIARNLVELTELKISNCKMLTEVISNEGCTEGPVVAFKQLKYMELIDLKGLTCFSSGSYTLMFPLLEDVIVTGCLNMELFSKAPIRAPKLKRVQLPRGIWFWNGNNGDTMQNTSIEMATVDGVEFMHLSRFSGLMEKWHSELIPIKSAWQLKSLVVDNCPSFLNVIPSKLMLVLDKIKTLQVQDCELLEEIFDLEWLEAMESTWVLPQLWCLNLINLPKLRQLWNKDLQGMLCFDSLSYLTLYNCNNLRHAFAPSMARCLPTLQWMEIKECGQMEGVIAEEGGERSAAEKITFPMLRWIELECLPNLTSFLSSTNLMLECPILQDLTIASCPKIKIFTWQSLMKIDRGISSPFTPQVLFPHVKSMVLSHMDNSSKRVVDPSQRLWNVEALEKLQVEFYVTEETGLPTVT